MHWTRPKNLSRLAVLFAFSLVLSVLLQSLHWHGEGEHETHTAIESSCEFCQVATRSSSGLSRGSVSLKIFRHGQVASFKVVTQAILESAPSIYGARAPPKA